MNYPGYTYRPAPTNAEDFSARLMWLPQASISPASSSSLPATPSTPQSSPSTSGLTNASLRIRAWKSQIEDFSKYVTQNHNHVFSMAADLRFDLTSDAVGHILREANLHFLPTVAGDDEVVAELPDMTYLIANYTMEREILQEDMEKLENDLSEIIDERREEGEWEDLEDGEVDEEEEELEDIFREAEEEFEEMRSVLWRLERGWECLWAHVPEQGFKARMQIGGCRGGREDSGFHEE